MIWVSNRAGTAERGNQMPAAAVSTCVHGSSDAARSRYSQSMARFGPLAILIGLGLIVAPLPTSAQVLGTAERAAARAAARSAVRTSEQRAAREAAARSTRQASTRRATTRQGTQRSQCAAIPQKCAGLLREGAARRILAR